MDSIVEPNSMILEMILETLPSYIQVMPAACMATNEPLESNTGDPEDPQKKEVS